MGWLEGILDEPKTLARNLLVGILSASIVAFGPGFYSSNIAPLSLNNKLTIAGFMFTWILLGVIMYRVD